ncbi:hypothetical protein ACHAC9_03065 [Massilia sp. CMS3.1]|uniref:hypothetical protein n=1 Tax=Massilia sp. CMS3.1 TaxID=3373083 RepID=UPI003EE442DC
MGVDYKAGALTTGASLAHRRGRPVRVTVNRGFDRSSRSDLDAYALWAFNPALQLRVAASNLLEQDDEFGPSYSDPVSGVETRTWRYPRGVSLRTTLEMTF